MEIHPLSSLPLLAVSSQVCHKNPILLVLRTAKWSEIVHVTSICSYWGLLMVCIVGDLHGDLSKARDALQIAGVLSSDGLDQWIGEDTVCPPFIIIYHI